MNVREQYSRNQDKRVIWWNNPSEFYNHESSDDEDNIEVEARFVITEFGELRLGSTGHRFQNNANHNDLVYDPNNKEHIPIISAGKITFNEHGEVSGFSNSSGHYRPELSTLYWLPILLQVNVNKEAGQQEHQKKWKVSSDLAVKMCRNDNNNEPCQFGENDTCSLEHIVESVSGRLSIEEGADRSKTLEMAKECMSRMNDKTGNQAITVKGTKRRRKRIWRGRGSLFSEGKGEGYLNKKHRKLFEIERKPFK